LDSDDSVSYICSPLIHMLNAHLVVLWSCITVHYLFYLKLHKSSWSVLQPESDDISS
jgi:hypothetical protein